MVKLRTSGCMLLIVPRLKFWYFDATYGSCWAAAGSTSDGKAPAVNAAPPSSLRVERRLAFNMVISPPLLDDDDDAAVTPFVRLIGRRHERVVLAVAGGRDRAVRHAVLDQDVLHGV